MGQIFPINLKFHVVYATILQVMIFAGILTNFIHILHVHLYTDFTIKISAMNNVSRIAAASNRVKLHSF